MANTTTPNYSFIKPEVDGDDDAWGTDLNTSLNLIDAAIKTVDDAAVAADDKAQAALDSLYELTTYESSGGAGAGPFTMDEPSTSVPLALATDAAPLIYVAPTTGQTLTVDLGDIIAEGKEREFMILASLNGTAAVSFVIVGSGTRAMLSNAGLLTSGKTYTGTNLYLIRLRAMRATGTSATAWFVDVVAFPGTHL